MRNATAEDHFCCASHSFCASFGSHCCCFDSSVVLYVFADAQAPREGRAQYNAQVKWNHLFAMIETLCLLQFCSDSTVPYAFSFTLT